MRDPLAGIEIGEDELDQLQPVVDDLIDSAGLKDPS